MIQVLTNFAMFQFVGLEGNEIHSYLLLSGLCLDFEYICKFVT